MDIQDFAHDTVFTTLKQQVLAWAYARQIIPNAKPHVQLMKTGSELGELMDAEIKGDRLGIVDGIGDVLVTLIIYAKLHDLSLEECLASAYDEIRERRGTLLPNGCFVKDEA
jgi:NTP pyrophosphatase (non-canonical NTP hydrolase)